MIWMMAAAMAMTAVSTAMQAKAAGDAGAAEQSAANTQGTAANRAAMEKQEESKDIAVQGQQEQTGRMLQLEAMIGSNAANAAGAGITADSGTLENIDETSRIRVGTDIANIAYNSQSKSAVALRQAGYNRDAARTYEAAGAQARSTATIRQIGIAAKGIGDMAMYGYFGGGGGTGAAAVAGKN